MTDEVRDHIATGSTGLVDALELRAGEVMSLVGGGGKTSIMFGAAQELARNCIPVVTTTTTKIMEPTGEKTPYLYFCSEGGIAEDFWDKLNFYTHVTLARCRLLGGKLKGIEPEVVSSLHENNPLNPTIIVEADGSAQCPFKAPNETEPVVPGETTLLVAVLGIEVIGRPLNPMFVFRPEIYSRMTGLAMGQPITHESVAASLAHPRGLLRDRPGHARVAIFINKVENSQLLEQGKRLAEYLSPQNIPGLCRVVMGRAKNPPSILSILPL